MKTMITEDAWHLVRTADYLDLHLDTFIPWRLWGYDLRKQHVPHPLRGRFFGHLDFPRVHHAGLTGAMWSITTNPARRAAARLETFKKNVDDLCLLIGDDDETDVVFDLAGYHRTKAAGRHAALLVIQGGNALSAAPGLMADVQGDVITAVTLVHLTHSDIGRSSTPIPWWGGPGLSPRGDALVESCNERRVFVDVAHLHKEGFWRVIDAHDKALPVIDTHTGVEGITPHWRNLDDDQVRAIADTGGVVAVIFQRSFLGVPGKPDTIERVVDHIEHIINVAGEDAPAIGSDYDGAIVPPDGMGNGAVGFPLLVQAMLDRGIRESAIRKVLGGNFLRAFAQMRPGRAVGRAAA